MTVESAARLWLKAMGWTQYFEHGREVWVPEGDGGWGVSTTEALLIEAEVSRRSPR